VITKTREDLQQEVLELSKKNDNLIIEFATGVGKTLAALNIIESRNGRWLVVIAELTHEVNWKQDIVKHGKTNVLGNITFTHYASLKKYTDIKFEGIIFDEAHHVLAPVSLSNAIQIKTNLRLFLSATIDDIQKQEIRNNFGLFAISSVTLEQAIDWNILPKPKIHLIPLELDNSEANKIHVFLKGNAKKRVKIICSYANRFKYIKQYKDLELHIQCTQKQIYDFITDQMEYWKKQYFKTRKEFAKAKWLHLGSERKRFMAECKTKPAAKIISKLKDKRFICFTGSIDQCIELGGKNIVHSKNDNNDLIIHRFNSKKINNIFAVGMLKEGTNLLDIEAGIIIQLSSKERVFVQQHGRVLRSNEPEQYILYLKNTQDETYLQTVIENMDKYIEK